jgi:glycosyltransferase involved in cell wall biosynthesis
MGIKRFFKNKIKDYQFIKNRRKLTINLQNLDFFKNHQFNFQAEGNPEVTIIISTVNDLKLLLNGLYQIEKYDRHISKEIIVLYNGDIDEAHGYLEKTEAIFVSDTKDSTVTNVNNAIKKGKGKFIYLLESHALVQENYLSTLLNVFEIRDNVGAVGSKLVSTEHNIVEAGNLVFKDSEISPIGQSESIDSPEFNYLRKVDFCEGSLLFHKKNKNGSINLLSESFSSLYFAKADFCLKMKNDEQLDTYYHPLSEIISFDNLYKAENDGDKKIFFDHWNSNIIKTKYSDNPKISCENHYRKPSFLLLEENMPKPDQDSGSRRFFEIVKILQKNGHRIILAVKHFDESTDHHYVKFFNGIGVEVCIDYVTTKDKIVKVEHQVLNALSYVDVIWIFRPIGFDHWYQLIKEKLNGQKIIYDMVDLHYLRMERENNYIDVITNERKKEIAFFKKKEYAGMNISDAVISISDEEMDTVSANGVRKDKIFTVSNIHKPVDYVPLSFSEREGLLFIGGYNHLPNIDAVKFLHDQIMPLVWAKNSKIKIFILGPDFPEDLKQKYHSDKFQILGYQKTVDFWFENARVFVAPLRYGAGVKGKIGQALEFKLPVITTGIGAEGMSLEDEKTALISDENPQNFADKILELYDNESLWQTLHENSLLPLSKFSIETQEDNIKKMLTYLGF